jgi:hypothetical protein
MFLKSISLAEIAAITPADPIPELLITTSKADISVAVKPFKYHIMQITPQNLLSNYD